MYLLTSRELPVLRSLACSKLFHIVKGTGTYVFILFNIVHIDSLWSVIPPYVSICFHLKSEEMAVFSVTLLSHKSYFICFYVGVHSFLRRRTSFSLSKSGAFVTFVCQMAPPSLFGWLFAIAHWLSPLRGHHVCRGFSNPCP